VPDEVHHLGDLRHGRVRTALLVFLLLLLLSLALFFFLFFALN